MKSISIKFSSKFKNFLEISEEILREVDNLSQEDHRKLMTLLEKYKLFYTYKYFFIDYPDRKLILPAYKIKPYISLYKQKKIDIKELSTFPFYHNTQEEAIYYIYANNPIKYSLSIHNLIKNIKREEKVNITSTNNIIRNLLLTPIDELDYQVMILDIKKETIDNDNTKKLTIKNQINKILILSNENFLSLFEMHQLYLQLTKIKTNNKHNIQNIEIIFEDYLEDGFDFNINKKEFIYEVIAIWKEVIKPHFKNKEWTKILDEINILKWDKQQEWNSLINKTKKEIKTLNDLLTVSHTVS